MLSERRQKCLNELLKTDLEWVISKILKAETMEELRKSLNEEKLI